ncbi:collagen alpha-5 chain [Achaetomium macrosporum]|uniref:Collagen alpha-5 chain n=1 Tax=Achaetomium macrosporum TaxID=79813 RepID=A0AAN7H7P8_9PEZI|nr:collagen alpha-5 chain [Achaetomium macrosporum]
MAPPSPSRSLFGSLKDKLSKSRSRSPSPNPGVNDGNNPFWAAPPSSKLGPSDPPPPPYSEIAPAVAGPGSAPNPTITINNPPGRAPSPAPSYSSARSDPNITSPEDPYAFLSAFDTIFLVDDSASMQGASWRETKEALRAIAPICTAHDENGIDVYFLNARNTNNSHRRTSRFGSSSFASGDNGAGDFCNIKSADQIERLFNTVRPAGGTPTGTRINHILKPYLREYEQAVARTGNPDECGVKPVNMIVITDGVPTDDPEAVIISLAKKLDKLEAPPHQVGIQFFQVGNDDGAAAALKELDDGLAEQGGGVRDMVDTVTWDGRQGSHHVLSADAILKVVLGAVVKRLDRRRISVESRRSRNHLAP